MPRKPRPIVFDVYRKGRRLCRAGVGDAGVLGASIYWVGGKPPAGVRRRKPVLHLHVGGLRHDERGSNIHPRWVEVDLKEGDEISIRIRRAEGFDAPAVERIETPDEIRRMKENYLNQLAPEHGWVKRSARGPSKKRRS